MSTCFSASNAEMSESEAQHQSWLNQVTLENAESLGLDLTFGLEFGPNLPSQTTEDVEKYDGAYNPTSEFHAAFDISHAPPDWMLQIPRYSFASGDGVSNSTSGEKTVPSVEKRSSN